MNYPVNQGQNPSGYSMNQPQQQMNPMMGQDPLMAQFESEATKLKPTPGPGGGMKFFKFEPNVNKSYYLRVFPSKIPGRLLPMEKILIHYNFMNPNTEKNGAFPCLSMWGLPCPLCRRTHEMKASTNFEIQAKAEDYMPVEGFYMYAQNMETNELGIWQFSGARAYDAFITKFKEFYMEQYRDFMNPVGGAVLRVDRSGQKAQTKYVIMAIQKGVNLSPELFKLYESFENILDQAYGKYTPDDYEKVLQGVKFEHGQKDQNQGQQPYQMNTQPQQQPMMSLPPNQGQPFQYGGQPMNPNQGYQPPSSNPPQMTPNTFPNQGPNMMMNPSLTPGVTPSTAPNPSPMNPGQTPPWMGQSPISNQPSSFPNPSMPNNNEVPTVEQLKTMLGG